jgi:hypothetical protein
MFEVQRLRGSRVLGSGVQVQEFRFRGSRLKPSYETFI